MHLATTYSKKDDLIPVINPGGRIMLSPPNGSAVSQVRVTTDNEIDIMEPLY